MEKRWLLPLLRRRLLVALMIFVQVALFVYFILSSSYVSSIIADVFNGLSFFVALFVASGKGESAYKLTWVFVILCFPVVGGILYLVFDEHFLRFSLIRRAKAAEAAVRPYMRAPGGEVKPNRTDPGTVRYLSNYVSFPAYETSKSTFYPSGADMFGALKAELEQAKHYIFMEYFIIAEGEMWDAILEILIRKVREGVRVRVIYDDFGCFLRLPHKYPKLLRKQGIEVGKFNPFVPFFSAEQNNRDHRKITVVDGRVAFTGGINLADEYIGKVEKHGKWADAAVKVEGRAAWSFTLMFLQMWMIVQKDTKESVEQYLPSSSFADTPNVGLVLPYADSPLDRENVGEQVYLQIIQSAKRYVYITTPYLIVDDKLISALTLAAKSGVDVRIITPHKWDKKFVHKTTRTYYPELVESGVKLYEYTPGFMHAKLLVTDDEVATVGSINFDFRSLFLHFECGVYLYESETVFSVKDTFLDYLDESQEIKPHKERKNVFSRIYRAVLRLLAPLM